LVKRVKKKVSGAGQVTLKLRPSEAAQARLQRTGTAKGKVTLRFTPTGGSTSSQSFQAKLKP
jgi:hypothetical protein